MLRIAASLARNSLDRFLLCRPGGGRKRGLRSCCRNNRIDDGKAIGFGAISLRKGEANFSMYNG